MSLYRKVLPLKSWNNANLVTVIVNLHFVTMNNHHTAKNIVLIEPLAAGAVPSQMMCTPRPIDYFNALKCIAFLRLHMLIIHVIYNKLFLPAPSCSESSSCVSSYSVPLTIDTRRVGGRVDRSAATVDSRRATCPASVTVPITAHMMKSTTRILPSCRDKSNTPNCSNIRGRAVELLVCQQGSTLPKVIFRVFGRIAEQFWPIEWCRSIHLSVHLSDVNIFSAPALYCRRAIAIPPASASASVSASASASASASTCKMLGQMLKSWNFSLSVIFLAF